MRFSRRFALISTLAALMAPAAAHAQWWAQHPAYVRAMSNLRQANWLLAHHDNWDQPANQAEGRAMAEIRAAYQELKGAAILDEKDIDDPPPPSFPFGDHRGRLHRAMDLLNQTHSEITAEEDNPAARGLRDRAVSHVDAAGRWTQAAINFWNY